MSMPFIAGSRATAAGLDAVIPQVQYVIADVPITSTTATALLSFPVTAGTWSLDGVIDWVQGGTQAKQALRIVGPAISFCRFTIREVPMSTTGESVWANTVTALNTDLSGASAGQPVGDNVVWDFDGVAVFTAAGTLIVQARCAVSSADTFTVKAGSFARLLQA